MAAPGPAEACSPPPPAPVCERSGPVCCGLQLALCEERVSEHPGKQHPSRPPLMPIMPWLIPGWVFLLSRFIYHWTHPCSRVPRLSLPTGGGELRESGALPGLRVEGSSMPCTPAALGKLLSRKMSLLQEILAQKGVEWAAWWTPQKICPCPRTCPSVLMWKRGLRRLS